MDNFGLGSCAICGAEIAVKSNHNWQVLCRRCGNEFVVAVARGEVSLLGGEQWVARKKREREAQQ